MTEGTYYVDKPLDFTSQDSGRNGFIVNVTGKPGDRVRVLFVCMFLCAHLHVCVWVGV